MYNYTYMYTVLSPGKKNRAVLILASPKAQPILN